MYLDFEALAVQLDRFSKFALESGGSSPSVRLSGRRETVPITASENTDETTFSGGSQESVEKKDNSAQSMHIVVECCGRMGGAEHRPASSSKCL